MKKFSLIIGFLLGSTIWAQAGETMVAVAANFTDPAKEIAAIFKEKTGHEAVLSFGATGSFYNQIREGAPFEVFLAADNKRPQLAIEEGFGVEGTNFTYAVGTLVLWSAQEGKVRDESSLTDASIAHIAFANPEAAPYGKAAIETLESLELLDAVKPRLVEGQNIAQAFQFVKTGNAEMGFVALSQVVHEGGSHWLVPQDYYRPIAQEGVLLKTGADSVAAQAFLDFLKTPEALAIIKKYGYGIAE